MVRDIPTYAYTWANAFFFKLSILSEVDPGGVLARRYRDIKSHKEANTSEKIGWIIPNMLYDCYSICFQIRCAVHKVTTQERTVGGGKEGGYFIFYIFSY